MRCLHLLVFHLFNIFFVAQCLTQTHTKLVRIDLKTENDVTVFKQLQATYKSTVDLWNDRLSASTPALVAVSDSNEGSKFLGDLQTQGINAEVTHEDVYSLIKSQLSIAEGRIAGRSSSERLDIYRPLGAIEELLQSWRQQYPDVFNLTIMGYTFEKRPIYAVHIKSGSEGKRQSILFECGIHAREWISPAICQNLIYTVLQKSDQNITALSNQYDLFFVPVFNADGYEYTWTTNRMWRKNRRIDPSIPSADPSCSGVDINRNFDVDYCRTGADPNDICSEIYCGPSAFSEPESKSMRNFGKYLRAKHGLKATIHIHSFAQSVTYPYGYSKVVAPKRKNELDYAANLAAIAVYNAYGSRYKSGQTAAILGEASGGSDDWYLKEFGIPVFIIESRDTGQYGFLLPENQINQAFLEAKTMIPILLFNTL